MTFEVIAVTITLFQKVRKISPAQFFFFLSQGLALTINGFDEGVKTKIMQFHGIFYG